MHIDEIYFRSEDGWCDALLYRPTSFTDESRYIVMAHGLGGEKNFLLERFAHEYCENGFGVLLFDYRSFGSSYSGKLPWHVIDPEAQIQDYLNAVTFLEESCSLNVCSVHLWGFSLSGGHVLKIAQTINSSIIKNAYVVAPFSKKGCVELPFAIKSVLYLSLNLFSLVLFRSHTHIPIVAKDGAFGLANFPGVLEAFEYMRPKNSSWQNKTPAVSLLRLMSYSPLKSGGSFLIPTAVCTAQKEEVLDNSLLFECLPQFSHSEQISCSHFDVLKEKHMLQIVENSVKFFKSDF